MKVGCSAIARISATTMQVLIIAVQNSVDYEHLGVATSGTMLFRSLGGALGVAMFGGVIFSVNGLHAQLAGPGMESSPP